MRASDFEYDGKNLSDFGMIICEFSPKGLRTMSNGSQITFNTVSTFGGSKVHLVSTEYKECLETTIQVCKNSCSGKDEEISVAELNRIMRWLCRRKYLKFKILDIDYIDVYFEASFNVNRIEFGGKLCGLELKVFTNRPYALKEPKTIVIRNFEHNGKHSFNDVSCEEGYIYPHTEIMIIEDGDLNIYNALEDRNVCINNCVAGEIITMDYPVVQSSVSSHNIQNDFNWEFFRIANTFENTKNDLTISIPCKIKIKYSPIVKVGL